MDKNLNNQPPIENDEISQIENQFEQQQTMQPQINANLQQQYMTTQVPNINVKKKGIGLGMFSLIVSIIVFMSGYFPVIYGLMQVIGLGAITVNGLFNIHFLGAIIDLIFVIFALIDNRMLGKILAIMASVIIFGSLILDFFVLYDFATTLINALLILS